MRSSDTSKLAYLKLGGRQLLAESLPFIIPGFVAGAVIRLGVLFGSMSVFPEFFCDEVLASIGRYVLGSVAGSLR